MRELVLRCSSGRHVLGTVSPTEGYGRLYVRCGKCRTWTPAEPPAEDPDLDPVRCCRRDLHDSPLGLDTPLIHRFDFDGVVLRHGELLAQVALAPGVQLQLFCQRDRRVKNLVVGRPISSMTWAPMPGRRRYDQTWFAPNHAMHHLGTPPPGVAG
jgi:hypothetical protein